MKKVLQVVFNMECGGIENFIISMQNEMKKYDLIFDYIYMIDEKKCYFDEKIRENGGKIFFAGNLNIRNMIKFYKNFRNVVKNNGPYEALHVHSFYNCGLISFFAKINGIDNVVTHSHTTKDNKNSNSLFRKMYRIVSKILIKNFADNRLACGIDAGLALYGKSKFTVINNGINTSKFVKNKSEKLDDIKKEINYNNKEKLVIHVGSFFDVKNHEYILKIAKAINCKENKIKFILLGDGHLKEKIIKKIDEMNLKEQVLVLGLKDNVEDYLLISDVFILPSKYEGFPISLVEAQTSGLHCIISDVIDKKVDIGTNGVEFLSIDDQAISYWCKSIMNAPKRKSAIECVKIVKDAEMDSESSGLKLLNVYNSKK